MPPVGSFVGRGLASAVRRGQKHIRELNAQNCDLPATAKDGREQAVLARMPAPSLPPTRKLCLCGHESCWPDWVVGEACWKSAPSAARREVYSRNYALRRAAVRQLTAHALSRRSPGKQAIP